MVAIPYLKRVAQGVSRNLPDRAVTALRPAYRSIQRAYRTSYAGIVYRGNQVNCPCCGWQGGAFLPWGAVVIRTNASCPRCSAKERHRLLLLYLSRETTVLTKPTRLLHFAPEPSLSNVLAKTPGLDYVTTDLEDPSVTINMDITNIQFEDDAFDCILCSHVLEHVLDDRAAMKELHRVLKPGGFAILQVPIEDRPGGCTLEDDTVVSPSDRERVFGQRDHVRRYGSDYYDRLSEAGFSISARKYAQEMGNEAIERYGLRSGDMINVCTIDPNPV